MKKLISVVLAAAMLISMTGCKGEEVPDFSGETESPSAIYENICKDAVAYFPSYDYSTEDGLPMMKRTGSVSLKDRFSEDEERLRPLLEEFVGESDFQKRCEITEEILQLLCEVEDISEEDGTFSKRKLTILRRFWDKDQEGIEEKVPEPHNEIQAFYDVQAAYLESAYEALVVRYTLSLICSLAYNNISYIKKYTDSEGVEYPYMDFFNRHLCYGLELEKISEKEFRDSVTAMAAYGQMEAESPRMLAEFYAYVEEWVSFAYDDDVPLRCIEIIEDAARELDEAIYGTNGVFVIFGDENDNSLRGWDNDGSDLLIAGKGNDVLNGKGSDDFLIGGEGDDIYEITKGNGCDTIFDCGGHNLIKFEGVSNVYAVGFSEDEFKNDVKIYFGGEYVIIRNFNANALSHFDVEINGSRIAYDSPENPLSDIHEPGYIPDTALPPS